MATSTRTPAQAATAGGQGRPPAAPRTVPPRTSCGAHRTTKRVPCEDTKRCTIPSHHCTMGRGWGTDHPGSGRCKNHLGSTPTGKAAAATEVAHQRLTMLGIPLDTDWRLALRRQIAEANGNVAFLRQECQALGAALVGEVMSDARDGELYATKEEARAIVRLYNEERDRLVKFCKVAADVGFAEAEIQLARQQGTLIATLVFEVLDGLALSPAKMASARQLLGDAFRKHSPSLATVELS